MTNFLDDGEWLGTFKGVSVFYGVEFSTLLSFLINKDYLISIGENTGREYLANDDWFYQTQYDILIDTGISEKVQRKEFKKMKEMELIKMERRQYKDSMKTINYFKLDIKKINSLIKTSNKKLLEVRKEGLHKNLTYYSREKLLEKINLPNGSIGNVPKGSHGGSHRERN